MKSKTKKNKIRQKKQSGIPAVSREWIYCNEKEVTLREICDVFRDDEAVRTEIWEEAGVVELVLSDGKSIDIERAEFDPEEDWAKEQSIQTMYWVTIVPDSFSLADQAMQKITDSLGGRFEMEK
jgi:hypothetical protein